MVSAPLSPNQKHILWIRVGALGDLLIATAALEESIRKYPDRVFWILGSPLFLQLITPAAWPNIQRIFTLQYQHGQEIVTSYKPDETRDDWAHDTVASSWTAALEQCDHVINHRIESYRYAIVPFLRRIPTRVGSCPWIYRFLYTQWSPWLGKDPEVHERDWHLLVAAFTAPGIRTVTQARQWALEVIAQDPLFKKWRALGLPNLKTGPEKTGFQKKHTEETRPEEIRPATRSAAGLASDPAPILKKLILVNPTSSRREKAWPAERFLTLVGRLRAEIGNQFEIRVIGAPNEKAWLNEVEPGDCAPIQPASLRELIDIVSTAHVLVTNTSSMQFIAAGTKTPTVTLLGRSNPRQWGPLGPQDVVVRGHVPQNFSGNIFQADHAALTTLTVEVVHAKIEELLGRLS